MTESSPDGVLPAPKTGPPPPEPPTYPDLDAPAPSNVGSALAVVFLVIIVILVALMATGLNEQIPYLHPVGGPTQVLTVYGDRLTYAYEFVANGSLQNITIGYICPQCPLSLPTGTSFTLQFSLSNPNNATEEVDRFTTQAPFALKSVSPSSAVPIAAGLSENFALTFEAPETVGTYVVPIVANINVS